MVDSNAPITVCPECEARKIVCTMMLDGKACPFCKKGVFVDSGWYSVS